MFKLNKDILFLIFEELKDDPKSLFSCLIVNRPWCETVIPILWRNPWCYHSINYSNKKYLFSIIAFYLSDDTKDFLERQGIQLSSVSFQSLSFDYLSLCRSINIHVINEIISIVSSSAYNQFLLQQEFYSLFIKTCPKLKYLNIKSIKHQVFYFPEAKARLELLYELKCDTSIDSSYFYGLARFCQYIQRLVIFNVNSKDSQGVAKLIGAQKNLKYFEWIDDFEDMDYFMDDPHKEILVELEKKANLLNHLKLYFQYLDKFDYKLLQNVLIKLYKLKTLISDFSIFDEQEVKTLFFNDLETLNIKYITLNEASILIENSGGNLKEVSLKSFDFVYYEDNFHEDSLNFIRKIHENCTSIEYLSLAFLPSKDHFIEFEKLLTVCQKLKSLLFFTSNFHVRQTDKNILENGKELLNLLIRSAPTNLRELRFFNDFKLSLETLEEFFEKWRGRPALSILTSDLIYEREDYKILFNNYKNNGIIKAYKYVSKKNIENMDFKI
jgi:hypothetical protein